MNLETIKYSEYEEGLPQEGSYILAQQKADTLFVYQAFNPRIASFAVENQQFGGPYYKYSRMSWIKPNFLWMMHRCGWAMKEEQKRVLAIEIKQSDFDYILSRAVVSSFKPELCDSRETWQHDLIKSDVRLQWDPDHHPNGTKLKRRAIQLRLRGKTLHEFGHHWIVSIQDITDFVLAQGQKKKLEFDQLEVIKETVYEVADSEVKRKLMLDEW